ncbi:MFS transporter, partial [Staphylococcus aureus]
MGIVGSVWGISSIIGPLLGGGILEFATWHWLFFINIPIAIIAIILVVWTFHFSEEETVAKSKFDTKGITLFYIFHWFNYVCIVKPIAIIAIILVVWTFHFSEEETVAKSKFDTKGIT